MATGKKVRTVHNYPSPRLVETIGATNQSPAEAIGELVANSFDARLNQNKLNITVDMRNGKIAVIDDGKGMTSDILEKAVCIAEDMSRYIERGENAKGAFGMGFKTSCATLGQFYEIYTRPFNRNEELHVQFDIADYSRRPSGADAWDVEIEEYSPDETSPLGDLKHGTAFIISRLKDRNIIVSAVLAYLGEAFKGHLQTGDSIAVIDATGKHDAIPKKYSFIEGTKVEFDEVFGPNKKYRVNGWVALDTQTHNDGLYGFNIYRHDQLVEKWDKSWFRAHLMTSRIIGEVNMDFLDATFYKQGVQQSEDWAIVSTHMREFLKPIVTASNAVSKKGNINNPTALKKIINDLEDDYGIEHDDDEPTEVQGGNKKPIPSKITETIKTVVKERKLVLDTGEEIDISYIEKEMSSGIKAPFDYIFSESLDPDESNSELQVIVFKTHPLWAKKIDHDLMKILATSDAIYRLLVEKLSYDSSEALRVRNEWLSNRVDNGE